MDKNEVDQVIQTDCDISRLEDVANILHEDIIDLDSENDKGHEIKMLIQAESLIDKRRALELDRLKLEEEKKVNESKAKADARKLEIEAKRVEYEKPAEKTKFEKFCDGCKAVGPIVVAVVTTGGVVFHEIWNRRNLSDVTKFEETGSFRSTGFRKWIK